MEKRTGRDQIRRSTMASAKLFVKSARDQLKSSLQLGFKTWGAMETAVAKARENEHRKRYGRGVCYPHSGAQQLARTRREGSPMWYAWKNNRQ